MSTKHARFPPIYVRMSYRDCFLFSLLHFVHAGPSLGGTNRDLLLLLFFPPRQLRRRRREGIFGRSKEEESLQGGPNELKIMQKTQNTVTNFLGLISKIYLFICHPPLKKGVFFRRCLLPNQTSLARGTIFDWRSIPHCSSRNNSDLTRLCSSEEDMGSKVGECFAFRDLFGSPCITSPSFLDGGSSICLPAGV